MKDIEQCFHMVHVNYRSTAVRQEITAWRGGREGQWLVKMTLVQSGTSYCSYSLPWFSLHPDLVVF